MTGPITKTPVVPSLAGLDPSGTGGRLSGACVTAGRGSDAVAVIATENVASEVRHHAHETRRQARPVVAGGMTPHHRFWPQHEEAIAS